MNRINSIIAIWSMRPAPGSAEGKAWEDGARQGWEWAMREAATIAHELSEKPQWSPGYRKAAKKIGQAIKARGRA